MTALLEVLAVIAVWCGALVGWALVFRFVPAVPRAFARGFDWLYRLGGGKPL